MDISVILCGVERIVLCGVERIVLCGVKRIVMECIPVLVGYEDPEVRLFDSLEYRWSCVTYSRQNYQGDYECISASLLCSEGRADVQHQLYFI